MCGSFFFSKLGPYRAQPHHVPVSGGDTLVVHENCPDSWEAKKRTVLLIHGLSGNHRSGHVARVAEKLNQKDVRTFLMDQRGTGAGALLAKGHTHAGSIDDFASVLQRVRELAPGSPISVIGFSLGGSILLNALARLPSPSLANVDSCFAISPPIDLVRCAANLQSGLNRFYDYRFVRLLRRQMERRQKHVEGIIDFGMSSLPGRLIAIDDQLIAPANGYQGADDYYRQCSSGPLLAEIKIPTVIVTAMDDPLVPFELFSSFKFSDDISLIATRHGGHLGFVGRAGIDPDRRWLDWRLCDWIQELPRS